MSFARGALVLASAHALACTPVFGERDAPDKPPVCPTGYATDALREARLVALATDATDAGSSRDIARLVAPVCFGPARSLGVLAGSRVVLRRDATDDELAARLAHLAVHLEDDLGDGCRHGLAAAVASEERAHATEDGVRHRLGLPPAPDDGAEAARDYARRCAGK